MLTLNIPAFKKQFQLLAKQQGVELDEQQLDFIVSEMQDTYMQTHLIAKNLTDEQKFNGAFGAGVFFGLSGLKRETCSVSINIKDGKIQSAQRFNLGGQNENNDNT